MRAQRGDKLLLRGGDVARLRVRKLSRAGARAPQNDDARALSETDAAREGGLRRPRTCPRRPRRPRTSRRAPARARVVNENPGAPRNNKSAVRLAQGRRARGFVCFLLSLFLSLWRERERERERERDNETLVCVCVCVGCLSRCLRAREVAVESAGVVRGVELDTALVAGRLLSLFLSRSRHRATGIYGSAPQDEAEEEDGVTVFLDAPRQRVGVERGDFARPLGRVLAPDTRAASLLRARLPSVSPAPHTTRAFCCCFQKNNASVWRRKAALERVDRLGQRQVGRSQTAYAVRREHDLHVAPTSYVHVRVVTRRLKHTVPTTTNAANFHGRRPRARVQNTRTSQF